MTISAKSTIAAVTQIAKTSTVYDSDLRIVIMKLTTAHLSTIANRLEDLSDELGAGITNLKKEIARLDGGHQGDKYLVRSCGVC